MSNSINHKKNKSNKNRNVFKQTFKEAKNIYERLCLKKERGKGGEFKIVQFFVAMASRNLPIRVSLEYLAKKYDLHPNSIARITAELKRIGIIRKIYHGFNKVVEYKLTKLIRDKDMQYYLVYLLPFLRSVAFSFFCMSGSFSNQASNPFSRTDVNLSNKRIIFNNNYNDIHNNASQKRDDIIHFSTDAPPDSNMKTTLSQNLAKLGFIPQKPTP